MTAQAHTFMFADISGYSLLTELEGDEVAAEVAISFVTTASKLATAHRAEVVKCLGDGVMVHACDAAALLECGLDLLATWTEDGRLPPIHVGIHTGPAIARARDWWGATVNIAARVGAAAGPGQLLLTDATMMAAGQLQGARLQELGALRAKNIAAPIHVYSASRIEAPLGAVA